MPVFSVINTARNEETTFLETLYFNQSGKIEKWVKFLMSVSVKIFAKYFLNPTGMKKILLCATKMRLKSLQFG